MRESVSMTSTNMPFISSPMPDSESAIRLKRDVSDQLIDRFSTRIKLPNQYSTFGTSLKPSGFWKMGIASKLSPGERIDLYPEDFNNPTSSQLPVLQIADRPWSSAGIEKIMSQLGWGKFQSNWNKSLYKIEIDNLESALSLLSTCWPDAHQEIIGLVSDVVTTNAPLRSSSYFGSYGAIWSGSDQLEKKELAFELLLHEEGHHALLLKEQRAKFLENPQEIHHHPLRPDPRPLRGVMHAAFVLWRMINGYRRLLSTGSGSENLFDESFISNRLLFLEAQLIATLEVLDLHARWTDSGQILRDNLGDVQVTKSSLV